MLETTEKEERETIKSETIPVIKAAVGGVQAFNCFDPGNVKKF
jgi:hypothetical protein